MNSLELSEGCQPWVLGSSTIATSKERFQWQVDGVASLEVIIRGTMVKGILPDALVKLIDVHWIGTLAIEVTYKATNVNYDLASRLALGKEPA